MTNYDFLSCTVPRHGDKGAELWNYGINGDQPFSNMSTHIAPGTNRSQYGVPLMSEASARTASKQEISLKFVKIDLMVDGTTTFV